MEMVLHMAGGLLAFSGILHLSAPLRYQADKDTLGIAFFGLIYAAISVLVFTGNPLALILGIIFPAIGLIGAIATFKLLPVSGAIKLVFILVNIIVLSIFLFVTLT